MTTGPLFNQLGTGAIPPEKERSLIERGIQFAAYFVAPDGSRCLVTSCYADMYQRLGEQLEQIYDEDHGMPVRYRAPWREPGPEGSPRAALAIPTP